MIGLRDVAKAYAGRAVLSGFNLDVSLGERVILFGPSGSGKTTILRLIAGLDTPDQGTVLFGGAPASHEGRILISPEERGLGYVFQDLALWPHMSVYENVEFPLKAKGVPKSERKSLVTEALTAVELDSKSNAYPTTLSGGQQQRVAIARALISNPRAVLMDEPLANLDEDLRESLCAWILTLQAARGFALVYVTHRRDEIARLEGRVVAVPSPRSDD